MRPPLAVPLQVADFFCDENVFDSGAAVGAARDQDVRKLGGAAACAPPTSAGGDASACSSPLGLRPTQQQQRLGATASCSSSSGGADPEAFVAELLTMIR